MHTTITTVLNTLIKVNHERIIIYKKAIRSLEGTDIAPLRLYRCMITESLQYKEQLESMLRDMGQEPDCEHESIGELIFSIWGSLLDKNLNTHQFSLCEVEEVVVQKAYEHALSQRLGQTIFRMLYEQHEELKISYGMIKGSTKREAVLANVA